MKVKELIADLQKRDPEMEVIWAIDDEGNAYHKLTRVGGTLTIVASSLDEYELQDYNEEYADDDDEDYQPLEVLCIN